MELVDTSFSCLYNLFDMLIANVLSSFWGPGHEGLYVSLSVLLTSHVPFCQEGNWRASEASETLSGVYKFELVRYIYIYIYIYSPLSRRCQVLQGSIFWI